MGIKNLLEINNKTKDDDSNIKIYIEIIEQDHINSQWCIESSFFFEFVINHENKKLIQYFENLDKFNNINNFLNINKEYKILRGGSSIGLTNSFDSSRFQFYIDQVRQVKYNTDGISSIAEDTCQ